MLRSRRISAVLIAVAYYLSFRLRFLESPGGVPERYSELFWGSIGFVVLGTVVVLAAVRTYEKWWRYFRLPDFVALVKGTGIATHLGRFTGGGTNCTSFDLATTTVPIADGVATFVAADGSTIRTHYEGIQHAPVAGIATIEATHTAINAASGPSNPVQKRLRSYITQRAAAAATSRPPATFASVIPPSGVRW